MRNLDRSLVQILAVWLVSALASPARANSFDLSGGIHLGGLLIGTRPRFAVSPHAAVSWRTEGGFLIALRDLVSIVPANGAHGVGAYNHASIALGYGWTSGRASIGPAVAVYSVPACGPRWCAPLNGVSPGLQAQLDYYFLGPLGLSLSATADWLTGSTVVPSGVAAMVLAGPSLRWSSK